MKSTPQILFTIAFVWLSVSCQHNQPESDNSKTQAIPEAFQEKTLNIESYSRSSNNLIDELYAEQLENSPQLMQLENDIRKTTLNAQQLKEKWNAFDNHSEEYYHSAEYLSAQITDSLLRQKIRTVIAKSQNKYGTNTKAMNDLLSSIDYNHQRIKDYHLILKIFITLPIIEQYQKNHLPASKEYHDFLSEQSKLIEILEHQAPIK
jgi:chromosome segregation ATPase